MYFHDVQTTYTGVYKNGGPDTSEGGAKSLQQITNRKPADARGVQLARTMTVTDPMQPRKHASDVSAQVKSMGGDTSSQLMPSIAVLPNALSMPHPCINRRLRAYDNLTHETEKLLGEIGHELQEGDVTGETPQI